tara:strand:- start:2065 stop:2766 length:702 start_codon:yes stop_codon:yes gene_type:complete
MILFLGCSFTWGAGLQFEYLFENGYSIDEIDKLMPPQTYLENLDYKADEYRKKHHFPNLVAKELNKPYTLGKIGNGGTNRNMTFVIDNISQLMQYYDKQKIKPVEMVIVQFTEFMRDVTDDWRLNQHEEDFEKNNNKEILKQIKEFDDVCKNKGLKWFGLSWHNDVGKILKKYYSDNFIPILQNNNEYVCFDDINYSNKNRLRLCDTLQIQDTHLSLEGHRLIANSILEKINV